jgi:gliding motility-associated-like protein
MKRIIYLVALGLLLFRVEVPGQFFANPSFEGTPGLSVPPPEWQPFSTFSTPDTEPLPCDHYMPSHGNTYLTLVTRGEGYDPGGEREDIITSLLIPLEPGHYYSLSVDLASRDEVGHFTWDEGFVAYNEPVALRIYGTDEGTMTGELLAESEAITGNAWERDTFILVPCLPSRFLILEVFTVSGSPGWGNLLLDALSMEELDELPLDMGELIIPNVFTPNGDGFNDELVIRGLRSGSSLMIYDRTGKELFKSADYRNNWDGRDRSGKDLPPGTYWYVLIPSHLNDVYKGYLYLKRE